MTSPLFLGHLVSAFDFGPVNGSDRSGQVFPLGCRHQPFEADLRQGHPEPFDRVVLHILPKSHSTTACNAGASLMLRIMRKQSYQMDRPAQLAPRPSKSGVGHMEERRCWTA
jgi:hypothetical protein